MAVIYVFVSFHLLSPLQLLAVCIFFSLSLFADQRGAQIDIHFSRTFSFYILRRSVRQERPEDLKEQESAGEIKEGA